MFLLKLIHPSIQPKNLVFNVPGPYTYTQFNIYSSPCIHTLKLHDIGHLPFTLAGTYQCVSWIAIRDHYCPLPKGLAFPVSPFSVLGNSPQWPNCTILALKSSQTASVYTLRQKHFLGWNSRNLTWDICDWFEIGKHLYTFPFSDVWKSLTRNISDAWANIAGGQFFASYWGRLWTGKGAVPYFNICLFKLCPINFSHVDFDKSIYLYIYFRWCSSGLTCISKRKRSMIWVAALFLIERVLLKDIRATTFEMRLKLADKKCPKREVYK